MRDWQSLPFSLVVEMIRSGENAYSFDERINVSWRQGLDYLGIIFRNLARTMKEAGRGPLLLSMRISGHMAALLKSQPLSFIGLLKTDWSTPVGATTTRTLPLSVWDA